MRVCVCVCECVHGLCLETVRELAKSSDSNLGAAHVKHLARQASNPTSLLERVSPF